MAADDVISKARKLPSGAVFHRCALQVNPHHYDSTYRGNAPSGDAVDYAGAIVQKASDLGVSVLAITDHNQPSMRRNRRDGRSGRRSRHWMTSRHLANRLLDSYSIRFSFPSTSL